MDEHLFRVTLFWESNGKERRSCKFVKAWSIEQARFKAIEHATEHVVKNLCGIAANHHPSEFMNIGGHVYPEHRGTIADFIFEGLISK